MTAKAVFTVGYWSLRGLGAPVRMMIMYRNIPMQVVNYDCVENGTKDGFDRAIWHENVKEKLKEENPLINLPYIKDEETGRYVTHSNACALYLGRKLNLLGENNDQLGECEQLLLEAYDIRNDHVPYCYGRGDNPEREPQNYLDFMLSKGKSLYKLNHWLERKYPIVQDDTPLFFVGGGVTAPDFFIWEMVDQIKLLATHFKCPDPFIATAPKLHAFHASFKALPENQNYLNSRLYALPCNNLNAKRFGATPSGDPWVFGSGDRQWQVGWSCGLY